MTTSVPTLEIHNPATGDFVGAVPVASGEDVRRVVAAATEAQIGWLSGGWRSRAAVLRRFHSLLHRHRDRILDRIQDETGKARRDALAEILSLMLSTGYYLKHGRRILARERRAGVLPLVTSAEVSQRPLGVVGCVTPWNYPFLLALDDAIPALLAGNSAVIKPSELTPHCAELAVELLREAGVPPEAVGVVHGGGAVGAQLIEHVNGVAFTGSVATGREVAAAAGRRLIPCSMELGGKNPAIVLDGADLDDTVAGLMPAAFFNSGQTCINVERIYVPRALLPEFLERAGTRAGSLRIGFSRDFSRDMGSLVSASHLSKVNDHVLDATDRGAEVVTGGQPLAGLGTAFYPPTLLAGVPASAKLASDETFGPVASVYPYDDVDEAVARANDTPYGLNASVWGPSGAARDIAARVEAGSVGVNSTLMIYSCVATPMGGVKASGVGRRHGEHGIARFTQPQTVAVSFAGGGGTDTLLRHVGSPRRAAALSRLIQLRRRLP